MLDTPTSTANPDKPAQPGSLLAQWQMLSAIIHDQRSRMIHVQVAHPILQNFWDKWGNSRASVRYLAQATGLSNQSILNATRDLVAWGYFTQDLGTGKRPTSYTPIWDFRSVQPSLDAISVPQPLDTSVQQPLDATDVSVPPPLDETHLRNRPTGRITESGNDNTPAAASPPPVPGLDGPDRADAARDPAAHPFDRFWRAFPRKYQKPKARVAWDKLDPDAELAERIITTAGEWAANFEANGTEKKWMPSPANWLAGERYDEDLPSVYEDPKEAAIAKARDRGPRKRAVAASAPAEHWAHTIPPGEHMLKVADSNVQVTDGSQILTLIFENRAGDQYRHAIYTSAPSPEAQTAGQFMLAALVRAAGRVHIDDSSELHDAEVFVSVARSGAVTYRHPSERCMAA